MRRVIGTWLKFPLRLPGSAEFTLPASKAVPSRRQGSKPPGRDKVSTLRPNMMGMRAGGVVAGVLKHQT